MFHRFQPSFLPDWLKLDSLPPLYQCLLVLSGKNSRSLFDFAACHYKMWPWQSVGRTWCHPPYLLASPTTAPQYLVAVSNSSSVPNAWLWLAEAMCGQWLQWCADHEWACRSSESVLKRVNNSKFCCKSEWNGKSWLQSLTASTNDDI